MQTPPIDRRQLVARHHVVLDAPDPRIVLAVGNGEFAFGADITGLQTFPNDWQVPLSTLAQWAWHSEPNPRRHRLSDVLQPWQWGGRDVLLPTAGWPAQQPGDPARDAAGWLERNPHRFNLGRVSLVLHHRDGRPAALADLHDVRQELDLWCGTLRSRFTFDGERVDVTTQVHPQRDILAISVDAAPALRRRIGIALHPQAAARSAGPGSEPVPAVLDTLTVERDGDCAWRWRRRLDDTVCHLRAQSDAPLDCDACDDAFVLRGGAAVLTLQLAFGPTPPAALPTIVQTRRAVQAHWCAFWQRGGAIDFSLATDARAPELERRAVLSQYLMAVHAAGSLPPQETGLAELSWNGKFHLEMHAWHAAQFALWGRADLLERSMGWYVAQLPQAAGRARAQGLAGARWPKMTGPEGRESPGAINPLIVWQQPHPIYLAELIYRALPQARDATLARYGALVQASAACIASLLQRDRSGRWCIGPPVMPVQEIHAPAQTRNPGFELAYFGFGLRTAQRWRKRRGLQCDPAWDDVSAQLAALPQCDGLYVVAESMPDLWQRAGSAGCRDDGTPLGLDDLLRNRCPNVDHPSFAGALGWLPGDGVDRAVMRRTLLQVRERWNLSKVWGWDFGMLAMTAARLHEPALAVDFLLHDSVANRWGRDGRVAWKSINAYLPANGALLAALALMAAGWDGCGASHPGFDATAGWRVRSEGLQALP